MDCVLIAQGDELTTGAVVDTNSHWLAGQLWQLGLSVRRIITAPDRLDDIAAVISEAAELAPIVICTGGLGATRDDLTAVAAAKASGRPLVRHDEALTHIEESCARLGREVTDAHRRQALLPEGARALYNRWGTAPAFAFDLARPQASLYFLPGVPREMRAIFEAWVAPEIAERHALMTPHVNTLRVVGVSESELETRLRGLDHPSLKIGFRAGVSDNLVKLVFARDASLDARASLIREARERIGDEVYGVDSGDLAEVVGARLAARGETLALAESCTAGGLAAWVGGVPGASRYLMEGVVVYSNAAKVRACDVDPEVIVAHGAVSEPVARQLAQGIRRRAETTWGVGITGIAGPGGGTPEKPVGTVHIAIDGPDGTTWRACRFCGDRQQVTRLAAATALRLLYQKVKLNEE